MSALRFVAHPAGNPRSPDAAEIAAALQARPSGPGRWSARCPAHEDRDPSLAIRQADDGRVLVHCHAGCTQGEVIEALRGRGLWPAPGSPRGPSRSRPARAEVESALLYELEVLRLALGPRVTGRPLSRDPGFRASRPEWRPPPDEPWEREVAAARRIADYVSVLYGERRRGQ